MGPRIDLTGRTFGRYTVLGLGVLHTKPSGQTQYKWRCVCACGAHREVFGYSLRSGKSKSCGCYSRDRTIRDSTTHGMTGTSTYKSWMNMRRRVYDPRSNRFRSHGSRGITISPSWEKFENFYKDMGERPSGMSLERLDNDGPYSKENCTWATPTQQARNRRSSRHLEVGGVTKTVAEWAEDYGHETHTVIGRLELGWEPERALTTPVRKPVEIKAFGKSLTIREWSEELGLSVAVIRGRINSGWEADQALLTPVLSPNTQITTTEI